MNRFFSLTNIPDIARHPICPSHEIQDSCRRTYYLGHRSNAVFWRFCKYFESLLMDSKCLFRDHSELVMPQVI